MSLAATEKPSGRFFSAAAIASRPPSSRAMPDSETLSSDSVILPSFSLPIWSSRRSAAASKRGGAPRASPIWSATSTLPRVAFAASNSLPLTEGNGALPASVTRTTSRSADHTKGFASGMRRVSSSTRRTPGTVSTAASAALRPSGENASAEKVTSRPATVTRFLSSTASLTAAFDRAAISPSSGSVLVQAAKAQKTTSKIAPGHHLLLHLKSPRIRVPVAFESREKSNPWRAVKPEIADVGEREKEHPHKGFFSHRSLRSHQDQPGQPRQMKQLRSTVIRAGLDALYYSGAHHLLRPLFAGVGAIFMLHHVRPRDGRPFQPNHHLEIEPSFLRATLSHLRALDIDIVTMDEAHRRLVEKNFARRFACFTLDDGYRDNRDHALPVFREFDAPCIVYAVSDFADGAGRLWWVALERAVAKASAIEVEIGGRTTRMEAKTAAEKQAAFDHLHDWLRALPSEHDVLREVAALCARHGVDESAICRELCMSWDELKSFAGDPLVTIGAHTITHPNLARQREQVALNELKTSRERNENAPRRD